MPRFSSFGVGGRTRGDVTDGGGGSLLGVGLDDDTTFFHRIQTRANKPMP
jgi:hypothetical protein